MNKILEEQIKEMLTRPDELKLLINGEYKTIGMILIRNDHEGRCTQLVELKSSINKIMMYAAELGKYEKVEV